MDREITAHADPDGETPWAMQLVVRAEKSTPPSRTAVCEAAAKAVVTLLTDPRATAEWEPAVARWAAGRIRKHVRRARGAKWTKVQELAGVTVEHAGAEVRAFVPCATDQVPAEVGKLQLSGLDLDDPAKRAAVEPAGPLLVISLQPDPRLGDGKAAAAAGHAAQIAWMVAADGFADRWQDAGFPVAVEQPDAARFAELEACAQVVVRDAGFTEVDPGTVTAVARWA